MSRRVVITGVGAVSAFGLGTEMLWTGLISGRTALGPITRFDPAGFRSRLGGQVPEFEIRDYVPRNYRKQTKVMARDSELAVAAAKLAVEDAKLITRGTLEEGSTTSTTYPAARLGCQIGAGLIAAETDEMSAAMATASAGEGANQRVNLRAWGGESGGGMEQLTPLWLLKYLPNMLACHVTIIHGAEGPSNTITCAEASGLLSIGESMRVIERGAADVCFSGGVESKLNVMGMLRLDLAGWLAATEEQTDPLRFVRPFDMDPGGNAGGLIGEGGAILMLEEAGAAGLRGAQVYAEVVGFGGGHSDPDYADGEHDEGYRFAIENALADAGVGPKDIAAIVPLGLGVPKVDRAELGALRQVFGSALSGIPLVTLTPALGDTVAGASALQAGVAAMIVKTGTIPARLHAGKPFAGIDAGPSPARKLAGNGPRFVLSCSGSLGGQNAAVVFGAARH